MVAMIILKIKEEEEKEREILRGGKDKLPISGGGGDYRHLKMVASEFDGNFILKWERYFTDSPLHTWRY